MRARPSCSSALPTFAVRARTELAKVYSIRKVTKTQHAICCARSTRCCSTGRNLAHSWTRWRRSAQMVAANAPGRSDWSDPADPGAELRLLPYLQTHLTIGEIGERLFVSRNTVSSEVALHLSQARCLLP